MLPALLTVPENASNPPGATGLAGQFFVTTSKGVGWIGQEVDWLALILVPPQTLIARAVIVSRRFVAQVSVGTRYEPVKFAASPGANVIGPSTGVLLEG